MRPCHYVMQISSIVVLSLALSLVAPSVGADALVRELAHGAPIAGTNGLAVGPDGLLYVTSVSGREIVVMDPQSGRILDRLGSEVGVETPDDATFGPDGSLYWTALFAGQVGRLQPDGTASIIAQLPPGPNPIAFNAQGRLFVGLAAFGDGLYEIDPDGILPPDLILATTDGLNGFAFGPDGFLYSPQTMTGSVARIDVDAGTVTPVFTGFVLPVALDFDSQGRLYVNDTAADEIIRIDLSTGEREVFAELSDGVDNLAFDADDTLYTTSLLQGSVRRIRQNGSVTTISPSGMTSPGGVAVLPSGPQGQQERVWVADFFSLRGFGANSGREEAFEPTVPGLSPLTAPATVSADGGQLIISSWILNAVQVFDPETGAVTLNVSDFDGPINAIRFGGDLVVAEIGTGSIVRADGSDPSQRQTLASGLAVPAGLAADGDDLYATDSIFGTVSQVVDGGQVLSPPQVIASGLAGPEGLAVLATGDLVVVEAGAGRVSRVEKASGFVAPIAENLELGAPPPPLVPPTWFFNGVAVGADGTLYVTGDVGRVLYKIRP